MDMVDTEPATDPDADLNSPAHAMDRELLEGNDELVLVAGLDKVLLHGLLDPPVMRGRFAFQVDEDFVVQGTGGSG